MLITLFQISCGSTKLEENISKDNQGYLIEIHKSVNGAIDETKEFWFLKKEINGSILIEGVNYEVFYISFADLLNVGLCCSDPLYDNAKSVPEVQDLNTKGEIGYISYDDALKGSVFFGKRYLFR